MSENPTERPPLTARYELNGVEYEGLVSEATSGGLRLEFDEAGPGSLVHVHENLSLHLHGGNLTEARIVSGQVVMWRSAGKGEFLELELSEDDLALVRDALQTHRSIRIPVRSSRAVRVGVENMTGEIAFQAALIDISESGLGIVMTGKDDGRVALAMGREEEEGDRWFLELTLKLPGNQRELKLIGLVRYRMWTRGCIKYGISFDLERTREAFPTQVQTVMEHMMAYQQALLEAA